MPDEVIPEDRAVLDHVVDGVTAVLLVGPAETRATLDAEALPEGVTDGTWLVIDPAACPPRILRVDEELTEQRRSAISDRMERIRQQRRGGRFDD